MSARFIKSGDASASSFPIFSLRHAGEAQPATRMPPFASEGVVSLTPFMSNASRDTSSVAPAKAEMIALQTDAVEETALTAEAARHEAEQLLANANARAAEIERAAEERGLAAAQARIAEEVAREAEPLRERLAATLNELQTLRAQIAQRAERDLVRLSIEIARKIVHREVSVDPDIVLTLARVVLSRLHTGVSNSVARIHLHPDDVAYVQMHQAQLEVASSSIEFIADRTVEPGGCLVHTEMGDIDARIDQQFAEIARGFLKA